MKKQYTYISLFSSSGIGCFGFKEKNFNCIATNEIIEERLEIQKINKKCKYSSGYIPGDILLDSTKSLINDEINFWKNKHDINTLDVLIATPPCQGMSTANYKKKDELPRNSLVVESLILISKFKPRYFIIENVKNFSKTICLDTDGKYKEIEEAIYNNLSEFYNINFDVVNFKDYGVPSSRPRTIVIGTLKSEIGLSPLLIMPTKSKRISLYESIGDLKELKKMGEFDEKDDLHFFREYPDYQREWIKKMPIGVSAFNWKIHPYKYDSSRNKILLKSGHLGNKFMRMDWNKPAPAIHTRSDQLASNRTIHPKDDRVLSIRELMRVMSIPDSFKWFDENNDYENWDNEKKRKFIKNHELKIRRSIGEAVPTKIFEALAENIIEVDKNPYHFLYKLQFDDDRQKENAAFYTPQSVVFNVIKNIEHIKKNEITILEPSAGWGTFLPQIVKKFQLKYDKIIITLMDIDIKALSLGREIFKNLNLPDNVEIIWKNKNFLDEDEKYDFIIGNPPYIKYGAKNSFINFINKSLLISKNVSFIVPKTILFADNAVSLRNNIVENGINSIIEFGVRTFSDVFIETISFVSQKQKSEIIIEKHSSSIRLLQKPSYILLSDIWIPYRDEKFDEVFNKIELDYFEMYRDRQISNKWLNDQGDIFCIKSKNILKGRVEHKIGYDKYVSKEDASLFVARKYISSDAIIVPNFTYNFRAAKLPKNTLFNGSVVLLFPKDKKKIPEIIKFFNTDDYIYYYNILQSNSKFTLNINKVISKYLGISK